MVYPIHIYGSPVLRGECKELEKDYPELKKLADDMFESMYAASGVGLAAPQIGKNIRMFVVDVSPFKDIDTATAGYRRVFVNPDIYEYSDEEVLLNEGCLSLPGLHEDVYRSEKIRIRYYDTDFVEHDEELDGWRARAVQHEYDHIEGIVFTDHLSPLRKTLIKNKLQAMTKGKFSADYRTKQSK